MRLCASLAASALRVHPELVPEQKAPVAKTRLSMDALRDMNSVGRCLALAATMMFVFDQDTSLPPDRPHHGYNGGYVPVHSSFFVINLMKNHPKDLIHQSRRRP